MYFEGTRQAHPDRRPFALHRNGYAGLQRFGWLWSGDTFSTWATLRAQIMVGINAGLSGIPYWGTDIGGFVPTQELTPELYFAMVSVERVLPLVPRARPCMEVAAAVGMEHGRCRAERSEWRLGGSMAD